MTNELREKRQRPAPRDEKTRPGRHAQGDGFPHLSSVTGACMCTRACCMGRSGCICGNCSGFGHENCVRGGWGT